MSMELNEKVYFQADLDSLEKEILNTINQVTESSYIGGLKVTYDEGVYTLFLYLDVEFAPIQLAYEGTKEEFKKYIESELKSRRLECIPRGRLVQQVINYEERGNCEN